jgi:hypothetical protein
MVTDKRRRYIVCATYYGETYVWCDGDYFVHEKTNPLPPARFSEAGAQAQCVRLGLADPKPPSFDETAVYYVKRISRKK